MHHVQGLLRMRTTPQLSPVRYYGRLLPDPHLDSLHHITACDVSDAFAVDFEFAGQQGFSSQGALPPTVQVSGLQPPVLHVLVSDPWVTHWLLAVLP